MLKIYWKRMMHTEQVREANWVFWICVIFGVIGMRFGDNLVQEILPYVLIGIVAVVAAFLAPTVISNVKSESE